MGHQPHQRMGQLVATYHTIVCANNF